MRKPLLILLAILVISLAACAGNPGGGPGNGDEDPIEGSLESILAQIYDTAELSENFKLYTLPGLIKAEITAETCEYHLGKSGLEYAEAIVSEHEISPSAYALCLVRAKPGADIEKLKQDIKDNANPAKWVCVGVDPSNVLVASRGDVIILVMSDTDAQALLDAFLAITD